MEVFIALCVIAAIGCIFLAIMGASKQSEAKKNPPVKIAPEDSFVYQAKLEREREIAAGNIKQTYEPVIPTLKDDEPIRCAKCGSAQITSDTKGFSVGKAAAGGILLGPVGLIGGAIGAKKIKLTCLKCGHSWKIN